jgi:hypothetical protein
LKKDVADLSPTATASLKKFGRILGRNGRWSLSHVHPWARPTGGAYLAASLVQLQPVFGSVSFDKRSPQDFLNKPGIIARNRGSPIDLPPAAKCSFIKLL